MTGATPRDCESFRTSTGTRDAYKAVKTPSAQVMFISIPHRDRL